MTNLSCFKAYDIRCRAPDDLNDALVCAIGRAYSDENKSKMVVVGYDVRLESPLLAQALTKGLAEAEVNVIGIGLCGAEEVYFQVFNCKADGGIMVTTSHNLKAFNGIKLVREDARPISDEIQ